MVKKGKLNSRDDDYYIQVNFVKENLMDLEYKIFPNIRNCKINMTTLIQRKCLNVFKLMKVNFKMEQNKVQYIYQMEKHFAVIFQMICLMDMEPMRMEKRRTQIKIGVLSSNINPQLMTDPQTNNSISASKSNQQPSLQQFNGLSKMESMMNIFRTFFKITQAIFLIVINQIETCITQKLVDTIVKGKLQIKKCLETKIQYEGDFLLGFFMDLENYHYKIQIRNDLWGGEWKNRMKDGKGRYQWPDGSVYVGDWEKDVSSGWGILTHAEGDIYEGEWKDDKIKKNISSREWLSLQRKYIKQFNFLVGK